MAPNFILLQASRTGEDICSMVLQDVAKAALCECAVDYGVYSPSVLRSTNMQLNTFTQLL